MPHAAELGDCSRRISRQHYRDLDDELDRIERETRDAQQPSICPT